jgi:group I intron endonuclease
VEIGIYKITSPSNKSYIGQSTNIEQRWKDYRKLIRCKRQTKLFYSLKKYGPENHIFEILEKCSVEDLIFKETFYKKIELEKVNNDWKKVLFCRFDGKGGKDDPQTRAKKSESKKGKSIKYNYPLIQYDYMGNFIKIWDSHFLLDKRNDIITVCFKKPFTRINNSLWRFKTKDNFPKKLKLPESYLNKINKLFPIIQKDLQGNLIKEYKNNEEVIELFLKPLNKQKSSSSIHACCKGKQKKAYGYFWEYKRG